MLEKCPCDPTKPIGVGGKQRTEADCPFRVTPFIKYSKRKDAKTVRGQEIFLRNYYSEIL